MVAAGIGYAEDGPPWSWVALLGLASVAEQGSHSHRARNLMKEVPLNE